MTRRKPIIVTITAILAVGLLVGFAYAAGRNGASNGSQHAGRVGTQIVAQHSNAGAQGGWMARTQARTLVRGYCYDAYGCGAGALHHGRHHDRWMGSGYVAGSGTSTPHHSGSLGGAMGSRSRSGYHGTQDHHSSYNDGEHHGGWDHDCW